jgi:hypothetical protein
MKQYHVVGLTFGTVMLFCCMTLCIVGAIVFSTIEVHSKVKPSPDMFLPKKGVISEIEHAINDAKFGKVNLDAAKEVKNGLFDRIRARRQASQACQPQPVAQCQLPAQTISYSYPVVNYCPPVQQSKIVIDPSDCTYSHVVATAPAGSIIVTQPTGVEMPITQPINPLDTVTEKDCPSCKKDPRTAIKTGAFICSNCRKSNVGEWHTDWNDDGTPITFLCKRCHSMMSPQQIEKSLTAYKARQVGKTGNTGLLHQEIGE